MLAYHNDPKIKGDILAQLEAHRAADEIVKGQYWDGGKGCAVACTVHSSDHMQYEERFGIPVMLARLEDSLFEGLPNDIAQQWPIRFMSAVHPGTDLSRVGWQFLHWLLTDEKVNPGINDPKVASAVRQCADVLVPLTEGRAADKDAAAEAAEAAAAAAEAAEAAAAAAEAEGAAAAAAAWAAEAEGAAAAYVLMADKLVELIGAVGRLSDKKGEA